MKNNIKRIIVSIAVLSMLAFSACADQSSSGQADTSASSSVHSGTKHKKSDGNQAESKADSTSSLSDETSSAADSSSQAAQTDSYAGVSDIKIIETASGETLSPSSTTVTIGNKKTDVSGAYVIDGKSVELTGGTYTSSETDQNVFLVINGGSLKISGAKIEKTGNASKNDSKRSSDVSDDYNFYGINSVILVVGEESSAEISDCIITSDCSGANAVFSTACAKVSVNNVQVTTSGNSSRGVYATYGGTIDANHVDITTSGAHCAPIATDRGGGYVTVTNSKVQCSGDGSPCIYSTGEIKVENVVGVSTDAQAAVIEGKNSITMTGCDFTVNGGNNGVMLYQSMSGDASDKDATAKCSELTMTGTVIRNSTDGPMFFVTNTTSVVNLEGGNTLDCANGKLVNAAAGRWGKDGSNGGNLSLNIKGDKVSDSVTADDISSVAVNVLDGGEFTGETSGNVMTG